MNSKHENIFGEIEGKDATILYVTYMSILVNGSHEPLLFFKKKLRGYTSLQLEFPFISHYDGANSIDIAVKLGQRFLRRKFSSPLCLIGSEEDSRGSIKREEKRMFFGTSGIITPTFVRSDSGYLLLSEGDIQGLNESAFTVPSIKNAALAHFKLSKQGYRDYMPFVQHT